MCGGEEFHPPPLLPKQSVIPELVGKSLFSDDHLSVIDHRLSVIDHHLSVIDHCLSVFDHRLSVIDHRFSVILGI